MLKVKAIRQLNGTSIGEVMENLLTRLVIAYLSAVMGATFLSPLLIVPPEGCPEMRGCDRRDLMGFGHDI